MNTLARRTIRNVGLLVLAGVLSGAGPMQCPKLPGGDEAGAADVGEPDAASELPLPMHGCAVDLDCAEGLGNAAVAQRTAAGCAEIEDPVGLPATGDEVLVAVQFERRTDWDAARLAAGPAVDCQDGDPAAPYRERSDDRLHEEARFEIWSALGHLRSPPVLLAPAPPACTRATAGVCPGLGPG